MLLSETIGLILNQTWPEWSLGSLLPSKMVAVPKNMNVVNWLQPPYFRPNLAQIWTVYDYEFFNIC